MWQMVAVWFALMVLGELLAPKPKKPKNDSQLEFPDNRQDRKIPLFAGTVQLRGPLLAWWGDVRKKAITESSGGMFGSTKTIVGYKYYGAMQLVLGHGKIDAVTQLHFGRKLAWTWDGVDPASTIDTGISIDNPELLGDSKAEGGISGTLYIHSGDDAQPPDSYLASKLGVVPAHGGISYCVWSNIARKGGGYLGNSKFPPEIWITVRRLPRLLGSGKHNIGGHANPAEFLYEMQVNSYWGAGMGTDQINTDSFIASANTLYDEGLGIAPLYADATDVDGICLDVLEHIDGAIYSDIFTGKRTLVLARADYTLSAQPLFDETNSILTDYSRPAWDETVNEVHVSFLDASTGEQATVIAQDLANQQIQQAIVARTIDYPACPTAAQAQKLAWRDVRALSIPLAKCTVRADRSAWVLRPGMVVRVSNALLGISELAMRVSRINYGTLVNGQIEFECAQDVFSLSNTIYGAVPATGWSDPTTAPAPALYEILTEAPYHLTRADPDSSTPEVGKLLTWAAAPSGDSFQYQIHTRQGADSYVQRGTAPFGATATLVGALAPGAISVQITAGQDLDLLEDTDATGQAQGQNLISIDTEWLSWRTKTDNGGGVWTLNNLYRGVLDTVPATHAAGARVQFLGDAMGTTADEYALTASVDAKYLPQTGRGTLPLASASNLPITLTQRVQRPYPPADVKINGSSYPAAILGAYSIAWKHRDRTAQLSVIPQSDASIGPEATTTYTMRLYGELDTLLRTETGLTGTSYSWTAEEADSGLGTGGDSQWPNVVALLHMDGADASTTFTDSTGKRTITVGGSAQIDTAQSKFGGASALFAKATADYLKFDASTDWQFSASDFTVEFWIRKSANSAAGSWTTVFMLNGGTLAGAGFALQFDGFASGDTVFSAGSTGTSWNLVNAASIGAFALNTWIHVAIERYGANLAVYKDGASVGSWNIGTSGIAWNAAWRPVLGGISDANRTVAGWIDEFRATKGFARYKGAFTPPDAPFPSNQGDLRLNGRIRAELESIRGGLTSHQTHNITVDRAGWGYNWGNYWGGI